MIVSLLSTLALAGCSVIRQPPTPTPPPFTSLYVVRAGPYPLYEEYGDWQADRVVGLSPAESDDLTMTARRTALARDPTSRADGPWLHGGCIFDVQRTSTDQHDASYVWAYGRVVRCDDPIVTGLPEPEMGIRPHQLRIYDGWAGYFPMGLLDPYTGMPPAPRS